MPAPATSKAHGPHSYHSEQREQRNQEKGMYRERKKAKSQPADEPADHQHPARSSQPGIERPFCPTRHWLIVLRGGWVQLNDWISANNEHVPLTDAVSCWA
jgi:hypothetical protein